MLLEKAQPFTSAMTLFVQIERDSGYECEEGNYMVFIVCQIKLCDPKMSGYHLTEGNVSFQIICTVGLLVPQTQAYFTVH